ncbi:MAG: AIR synthase related protein [Candidatus Altiarchaeota archaeon]
MRINPTEKYVKDIEWIREKFISMDRLCKPVMGINDWDDSVIVNFGGKKLVVSVDGPYAKRLALKSALIHAATDVVVKGAKPMFALDTVIGLKPDVEDIVSSLKNQAEQMKIPLLGGNTLLEDSEARCSITVVGELLLKEPIRDCNAKKGDVVSLLGEPIWGGQGERIEKARRLFKTWYSALEKVKINSAKDVTKGGLVSVVYEMEKKSRKKFKLKNNIQYSLTRNLDNFILTLPTEEYEKLKKISEKNKCRIEKIGVVM